MILNFYFDRIHEHGQSSDLCTLKSNRTDIFNSYRN